jgi:RNA polymerase sigma factor (sigma-70 family)
VSRGPGGAVLAPADDAVRESPSDSDERLVAAVRRGEDRAFETLYQRYQRRVHAYVLGMVKDHGRAEDVTQEVFVSALRRMRATDRQIAFKPWVYEIAKNACIDAFRRSKRAEEVSYDAEGGLAPGDHLRLVGNGPTPEAAVAAKHDLETLCGAFGGLSESHHEILVLRELEGLTYEQIGERMGMTRPAVESTLFRARRRLTEEYDELVSGARCLRVQAIIAGATSGPVGLRDSRRLSRHLAHCQPCRREALAAGLDRGLLVRRPARTRIAEKIAGLLPFPAFLRLRRGGDVPAPEPPGARLAAHLPALSDQLSAPWTKAATGAALLLAGVGTGVGVHHHAARTPAQVSAPAAAATPAAHKPKSSPAAATTGAKSRGSATARDASSRSGGARGGDDRSSAHRVPRNSGTAADRATSVGGGTPASTPAATPTAGGGGADGSGGHGGSEASTDAGKGSGGGGAGGAVKPKVPPTAGLPATASDPVKQVTGAAGQTTGAVDQTVQQTTGAAQGAVQQVTDTVDSTVQQVAGDGPVSGTVQGVTGAVNGAVGTVKQAVDGTVGAATGTVGQVAGGLLGGH